MENDPAYAKGFRKVIKPLTFEVFWNRVAEKLNPLWPPVRDGDGWLKERLQSQGEKKLVDNKPEARATGGGAYKQVPLSSLEEAVANLLQFEVEFVVGFAEQEKVVALPIEEEKTPNLPAKSGLNIDVELIV